MVTPRSRTWASACRTSSLPTPRPSMLSGTSVCSKVQNSGDGLTFRNATSSEPGTVASNRWASGTYRTDTSGRARSSSFADPLTSPPPGGVEQFGPSPRPSLLDGPAHGALRAGEGAVDCGPEVLEIGRAHV